MDQRFEDLLVSYSNIDNEHHHKMVENTLWTEFGVEKAIFVMDMSGFSRLTQKYGIVHYLSMVKRMQMTTKPLVEQHGGSVVKFEADNCFAMFDNVLSALDCAIGLNKTFDEMNELTEDAFDIRVSIGIDYGKVLLIGGPDYFGNTVNRACKLGEDIAGPGEILITKTAYERLTPSANLQVEHLQFTTSGISLDAVKIKLPASIR